MLWKTTRKAGLEELGVTAEVEWARQLTLETTSGVGEGVGEGLCRQWVQRCRVLSLGHAQNRKADGTEGLDGMGTLAHSGTLAFIPSEVSVWDHEHGHLQEMQE